MAYQPNIPQATDQISVSQLDIQGNFQALATAIAKDHYAFGTANEGKHIFNQAAAPTVATATQVGIYCAALGGNPELYINKAVNAGWDTQIPFTKVVHTAANGYTYLPSGIIIQWGSGAINAGTRYSAVNAFSIPFPKAVLSVQITGQQDPAAYDDGSLIFTAMNATVANFTAGRRAVTGNVTFYYIAIGY